MHLSATNHDISQQTAVSHVLRWIFGGLVLAIFVCLAQCVTTRAQTATPAVKHYILDLGQLKSANPQPLLDRGVTSPTCRSSPI